MISDDTAYPQGADAAFYDQYVLANKGELGGIAEQVSSRVEGHFAGAVRRDAASRRRAIVANLLANLAVQALGPPDAVAGSLAVPTADRVMTRYDRSDYPKRQLRSVLQALEMEGVIRRHDYVFKQRATTIEPTSALLQEFERCGADLGDVSRLSGAEAIWLLARTGERHHSGGALPKVRLAYEDTAGTLALREKMSVINDHLATYDLKYDARPMAPQFLRRAFTLRSLDEAPAFTLNGRLFGGTWQNISSRHRHLLTLRGERLADLDYSSMFARLAYLKAKEPIPDGDLYEIGGLESHRAGAKTALLSLLSRSAPMKSLTPELKDMLPDGWTARRLTEALASHHPRIAHLFGSDVGLELMFAESKLLVAVLLKLAKLDVPALPMHDGVMVPADDADKVHWVMEQTSKEELGVLMPVKLKPIWRPSDNRLLMGGLASG